MRLPIPPGKVNNLAERDPLSTVRRKGEAMTTDSDPAVDLTNIISRTLHQAAELPAGTLINNAVVCVQTVRDGRSGPEYDIHRLYPLGPIDPSSERGILRDALRDSDAERHNQE